MSATLNSIFNIIPMVVIFLGVFIIYLRFLFRDYVNYYVYQITRVGLALLLTFSLARILFDLNIIITGEDRYFNLLEAGIALGRNYGYASVLLYLIYIVYVLVKLVTALKTEIELLKKQLQKN